MTVKHQTAKTEYVSNGSVQYAYRRFGQISGIPLVFLIHFRGTMDFWDPLLINSLASTRPVILVDNAGVGQSSGEVADTYPGMARHVINFLSAMKLKEVDVIGFSMGGMIAQLVALNAPAGVVRKLVIAGSGTSPGEGTRDHPVEQQKEVGRLAGKGEVFYEDGFDKLFFYPTETSQEAGHAWWKRIFERDQSTSGEERSQLVSTNFADKGAGLKSMVAAGQAFKDQSKRAEAAYDRLGDIKIPVFIGQGKDDFMIPTLNSFVMQQKIPNARLKIFPDSGHGFLYQYAEEFAHDVATFLDELN